MDLFNALFGGGKEAPADRSRRPPSTPPQPTAPVTMEESALEKSRRLQEDYNKRETAARSLAARYKEEAQRAKQAGNIPMALAHMEKHNASVTEADGYASRSRDLAGKITLLQRARGFVAHAEVTGEIHMAMSDVTANLNPETLSELQADLNDHASSLDTLERQFSTPVGASRTDLGLTPMERNEVLLRQLDDLATGDAMQDLEAIVVPLGSPMAPARSMGTGAASRGELARALEAAEGPLSMQPLAVRPVVIMQPQHAPPGAGARAADPAAERRRALAQKLNAQRKQ